MAITKQYLEDNIKSANNRIADIDNKIRMLNHEKSELIGNRNTFQAVLFELTKSEE